MSVAGLIRITGTSGADDNRTHEFAPRTRGGGEDLQDDSNRF